MQPNGHTRWKAQSFAAQETEKPANLMAHLLRTPRRESEGGNPSAVLRGLGYGKGENRNSPFPYAFFGHLSLRKERCKQFSSKRTQQVKSLHLSQNNPVPLRHFLFCCLCLLSLCPPRQQNSPTIFRKNKSAPLGVSERSGIFIVLLCYIKKTPGRFLIAPALTSPPGVGASLPARVQSAYIQRSWRSWWLQVRAGMWYNVCVYTCGDGIGSCPRKNCAEA